MLELKSQGTLKNGSLFGNYQLFVVNMKRYIKILEQLLDSFGQP